MILRRYKMKRIAKFEKVSLEQFRQGYSGEDAEAVYAAIKLPRRATSGSAGYDIFAPFNIELAAGDTAKIPTGIRVRIVEGWLLSLYPRSGLGFKFRLQLDNTVGIIDSDYYFSDNEGHIFAKITNDSKEGKTVKIAAGTGFIQGIFTEYGITEDDDADGVRNGGFGSTTKAAFIYLKVVKNRSASSCEPSNTAYSLLQFASLRIHGAACFFAPVRLLTLL